MSEKCFCFYRSKDIVDFNSILWDETLHWE